MTTSINITRSETVVRPDVGGVVNVSVVPRLTSVTVSNQRGPQGATGNSGLTPVFTRQGTLYPLTGQQRFYVDRAGTVNPIRVSVGTPPVGSAVVVNVLKNNVQIASLSIPSGSYTSVSTATVAVDAGDYFTVNIASVGSTTPGADLTVAITIN